MAAGKKRTALVTGADRRRSGRVCQTPSSSRSARAGAWPRSAGVASAAGREIEQAVSRRIPGVDLSSLAEVGPLAEAVRRRPTHLDSDHNAGIAPRANAGPTISNYGPRAALGRELALAASSSTAC